MQIEQKMSTRDTQAKDFQCHQNGGDIIEIRLHDAVLNNKRLPGSEHHW